MVHLWEDTKKKIRSA